MGSTACFGCMTINCMFSTAVAKNRNSFPGTTFLQMGPGLTAGILASWRAATDTKEVPSLTFSFVLFFCQILAFRLDKTCLSNATIGVEGASRWQLLLNPVAASLHARRETATQR